MPLQATSGAASYDAFGGVPIIPQYIEEVFSTWLYASTSTAQTINNGIDLAGKGGMVWWKSRSNSSENVVADTVRGGNSALVTNTTAAANTASNVVTFTSSGVTTGPYININGWNNVLWTFRKQPKFFDVVTYTGNGNASQTISHNLGSEPGCVIVKRTNAAQNWVVVHRSISQDTLRLNLTDAKTGLGGNVLPSATNIEVYGTAGSDPLNASGATYVAYLFAHNAGGFGLSGTDNVISCGSYTGNGSATGPIVSLGYEPQWLMVKNATSTGNWNIIDNMRGMPVGSADAFLEANTADAEATADWVSPTATGFQITSTSTEVNTSASTYIYIAIRRGPMKVPTTGERVYANAAPAGALVWEVPFSTSIVTPDALLSYKNRTTSSYNAPSWNDRLRGFGTATSGSVYQRTLFSNQTIAETTAASSTAPTYLAGVVQNTAYWPGSWAGYEGSFHAFVRAPSFFDVVCYTGTGANRTVAHNLAAVPELMIVKGRSGATAWQVYSSALANTQYLVLNTTAAVVTGATRWNSTTPTSSVFSLGTASEVNTSAATYVAYLFASAPGVSKVGSYTGTGTTQTINCGFTAGSRFVMIKRTNSTGDWYVWNSARGIVAGNDPYQLLNSDAAEVTNTDFIDTAATGFEISSTAPAAINASGGAFIFLAIA